VTLEQDKILKVISAWADKYPCIKAMYVFGSVARNEATATSDLDIAFEYVSEVRSYDCNAVGCYTTVNDQWEQLVEEAAVSCRINGGRKNRAAPRTRSNIFTVDVISNFGPVAGHCSHNRQREKKWMLI
jgi:predicted nucleotidyltransferase